MIQLTIFLCEQAEKTACEKFCDSLKEGLQTNVVKMKGSLRGFLETCKSEELLETSDSIIHVRKPIGGLGLQFGYRSDTTEEKDNKKLQSWIKYFHGKSGCYEAAAKRMD